MKPSEVIEKYGWVQGRVGNPFIGFCLVGAICCDEADDCHDMYGVWPCSYNLDKTKAALGKDQFGNPWNLSSWNDQPDRTKEEVIELLRSVGL